MPKDKDLAEEIVFAMCTGGASLLLPDSPDDDSDDEDEEDDE